MTDLARTLAAIAAPLGGPARKDPPYDGHYTLDWEGVRMRVPYWIANERDLGTEMPEIELGPVADWRVLGLDESRHGAAQAIRDVISETVDVDYRSSRVDDPADRGVEYDR
jgi:hypothetical protein